MISTLDRYRSAEKISASAAAGTASTEDLRLAMIHYRALFSDLLGEPADAQTGPAAAEPAQATEGDEMTVIEADDTTAESSDAQIGQARSGVAAGDPGMDGAGQQLSGTGAGELMR